MIAFAALALTSCNEDFGDWLSQNTNDAPAQVTVGGLTFAPVSGVIDYAELDPEATRVKVADVSVAQTSADFSNVIYRLIIGGTILPIDADGTVDRAELEALVLSMYGREPVARDIEAYVEAIVGDGNSATRLRGKDPMVFKVKPDAPVIESAYYYIGTSNGWAGGDTSYPLSNGGMDPYENPVFSVVVPITEENGEPADNWFKIFGQSALERENFWDGEFVGYEVNGENGLSGKVTIGMNDVEAFAFKFSPADYPAKVIRITVNFMTGEFSIEPLNFTEYIYEVGVNTGWSSVIPMRCKDNNGQYRGFAWLNGEFKFRPNEGDWSGDWEYVSEGSEPNTFILGDTGGPNVPAPQTGYYMIEVDLGTMIGKLTPISVITMIGSAINGDTNWGTEYEMVYNENSGMWEWEGDLTDGEFKFRADHGWAINWGLDGANGLCQDGNNIPATAGHYKIQLRAWCDGDANYFIE